MPAAHQGRVGPEQAPARPPDWRERLRHELAASPDDAVDALRRALRLHISDGIFTGRLRAGDRLPSIRGLAHAARLNHKVVAEALRELAEEGLLEVRERSGVYVSSAWRAEAAQDPEVAVAAAALAEAWSRGVPVRDLVRRLGALGGDPARRCVCVDRRADYLAALARELRTMFSLSTTPVCLPPDVAPGDASVVLDEALRDADVVACTPHVAAAVLAVAEPRGLPVVVVTREPDPGRPLSAESARALAEALLGGA
ncbi:MAG TPA: winged helix-turn-helix domain-containing protein [Longimicrobiales bacterium]|nr:winged helix-turn-helix domain-containing protein [Longimicrobiales bacterium]